MGLAEQMIAQIEASGINDYDQRSALGMARSWVDKREPIRWNPEQVHYEKRDDLAQGLVGLMEANPGTNEEYVEALLEVRKKVNGPYQRTRVERGTIQKPGEKKKAKGE
jgi:hypothetical protein